MKDMPPRVYTYAVRSEFQMNNAMVGDAALSEEQAAEQSSLSNVHEAVRTCRKRMVSLKSKETSPLGGCAMHG